MLPPFRGRGKPSWGWSLALLFRDKLSIYQLAGGTPYTIQWVPLLGIIDILFPWRLRDMWAVLYPSTLCWDPMIEMPTALRTCCNFSESETGCTLFGTERSDDYSGPG